MACRLNVLHDYFEQMQDPTFTYKNFTIAEQDKILACGRSNNELCTAKFLAACPGLTITPAKKAIVTVFEKMRANLDAGKNEDGGSGGGQRRPPHNAKRQKVEGGGGCGGGD